MRSAPRRSRTIASTSSRAIWGLRFSASRHCSVVRIVPRPSERTAPPSSTIGTSTTGSPSAAAISAPIAASCSHGGNFSPQALKRQCVAVRLWAASSTT